MIKRIFSISLLVYLTVCLYAANTPKYLFNKITTPQEASQLNDTIRELYSNVSLISSSTYHAAFADYATNAGYSLNALYSSYATNAILANNSNLLDGYPGSYWMSVTTKTIASSQWSVGLSSSLYYTSGNVGIGTSAPVQKLDVNGNLNIGTTNQIMVGNQSLLSIGAYSGGTEGLNLGIDNAYPIGLENTIIGNSCGSGIACNTYIGFNAGWGMSGDCNTALGCLCGPGGFSGYIADSVFIGAGAGRSTYDASDEFILQNAVYAPLIWGDFQSGAIGIGTTNPAAMLDDNGNFHVGTDAQIDENVDIGGNVGIGISNPSGVYRVAIGNGRGGSLSCAGTISANQLSCGSINSSDVNIGINHDIYIASSGHGIYFGDGTVLLSTATLGGGGGGLTLAQVAASSTNVTGAWNFQNEMKVTDTANADIFTVGVSTSDATGTDYYRTLKSNMLNMFIQPAYGSVFINTQGSNNAINISNSDGSQNLSLSMSGSDATINGGGGNLAIGTGQTINLQNGLYVDNSGNVGIGTTAPVHTIDFYADNIYLNGAPFSSGSSTATAIASGNYFNDVKVSSAIFATNAGNATAAATASGLATGNYLNDVKVSSAIFAANATNASNATGIAIGTYNISVTTAASTAGIASGNYLNDVRVSSAVFATNATNASNATGVAAGTYNISVTTAAVLTGNITTSQVTGYGTGYAQTAATQTFTGQNSFGNSITVNAISTTTTSNSNSFKFTSTINRASTYGTLTPVMTGNTSPYPFKVTASQAQTTAYSVFGKPGVYTGSWGQNGGAWTPEIITFFFGYPTVVNMMSFLSYNGYYSPQAFTVSGSNDNSTWTVMYSTSGINTYTFGILTSSFTWTNTNAYNYVQLSITDGGNGSNTGNGAMIFGLNYFNTNGNNPGIFTDNISMVSIPSTGTAVLNSLVFKDYMGNTMATLNDAGLYLPSCSANGIFYGLTGGGFGQDSSNFVYNATSQNVGIGLSNPQASLDIYNTKTSAINIVSESGGGYPQKYINIMGYYHSGGLRGAGTYGDGIEIPAYCGFNFGNNGYNSCLVLRPMRSYSGYQGNPYTSCMAIEACGGNPTGNQPNTGADDPTTYALQSGCDILQIRRHDTNTTAQPIPVGSILDVFDYHGNLIIGGPSVSWSTSLSSSVYINNELIVNNNVGIGTNSPAYTLDATNTGTIGANSISLAASSTTVTVYSLNTSTNNQTAIMTTDSAPSPAVASASTEYTASWQAWKAFDHTWPNNGNAWFSNADMPCWLMYDCGYSTGMICNTWVLHPRTGEDNLNRLPKNFLIQGSTATTNWITLSTQTNQSAYTQVTCSTYNQTPYRYYRLYVSANNGDSLTSIGELEMFYLPTTTVNVSSNTFTLAAVMTSTSTAHPSKLSITENNTEVVSISTSVVYVSGANVGIGTTNPAAALDVNGVTHTNNDVVVNNSSAGVVLKDAQSPAHYWRIMVTTLGVLTTTDLGTTPP